jgi:outer membrane protein TolC
MSRFPRWGALLGAPLLALVLEGSAFAQVPTDKTTPSIGANATFTKLETKPGGITADSAAQGAVATSKAAKVDEAKLKAAAAQVDLAWDAYLPRLALKASYTRLSPIDPPAIALGPPGSPAFAFPVYLNQYGAQASLLVPLSDYVFRIYQGREAALASAEAATWSAKVTKQKVATDARVAFYNVLRARGGVIIANAALSQSQAHLADLNAKMAVKDATAADVARVEAQVAGAELAVIRAENLVEVTEANLRVLMHLAPDAKIDIGEDLDAELPKAAVDSKALTVSALAARPELKAFDAQIASANAMVDVASAGMYPRLDAIGNVYYSRPNPRFVPTVDELKTTWDASLVLSWSPNDLIAGIDQKKNATANVAILEATKEQLTDGVILEVTTAATKVKETDAAVIAAAAERRAAEEAYRVRREQFHQGLASSALLIDAEADLTRARLNELNARADLRIARAQLKRAAGAV